MDEVEKFLQQNDQNQNETNDGDRDDILDEAESESIEEIKAPNNPVEKPKKAKKLDLETGAVEEPNNEVVIKKPKGYNSNGKPRKPYVMTEARKKAVEKMRKAKFDNAKKRQLAKLEQLKPSEEELNVETDEEEEVVVKKKAKPKKKRVRYVEAELSSESEEVVYVKKHKEKPQKKPVEETENEKYQKMISQMSGLEIQRLLGF